MNSFPADPGSYALLLRLDHSQEIRIGHLGLFWFPSGAYIYSGSACGPGGLRGRLARHLLGGKLHWHIDYFRQAATITGVIYTQYSLSSPKQIGASYTPYIRLECSWSKALASLSGSSLPAPGFGSSDCRSHPNPCPAHLVHFQQTPLGLCQLLAETGGLRIEHITLPKS